ncbi:hypothetical protein [Embleya sp. NBC_00896]|uniref:hypothetical protein n=1 Tax=Embleya sp. NBC_00896 TaxID=2975961 RepID=UPI002F91BD39|nr:hypothetical protein OG928_43665 [Embleya sp. NBC_00896]
MVHAHARGTIALLVVALFSATTACTVAADVVAAGSPSQAAPSSSAAPSTAAPAPDAEPYLTTRELQRALLTKADMPKGWVTRMGSNDVGRDRGEGTGCERLTTHANPASGLHPVEATADILASDPAGGKKAYALFGVSLTSLASGDAQRVIPAVRDAVPGCSNQQQTVDDLSATVTAREIQGPGLGDESVAIVITTRVDDGRSWVHSVVLVRVGTTLIRAAHVNLTGATPHHPDPAAVRKQVEQVAAAVRAKG